ncbi:hypothetical protein AQUCO_03300101v1 [Aquilegia coerulea]|uniref:At1g61320/AtMIF1 LRR domain-containing protein n=1 Tax=Aquilegia coerulea TaxID=218851 RepID=A0A2G5CZF8_AQUCA|nr:hypothetical protein AQUCO_03300101v1 [Aquilegia coerulea]
MPFKKSCIRGEGSSTKNKIIKSVNFPDEVVENIFSYLPVKLAERIGARAERFRCSWKLSHYLDFDKDFAEGMTQKEYVNTVVWIMMFHKGTKVRRFRLYSDASLDHDLFQDWLDIIDEKGVEEVDLDFSPGKKERFVFYSHLIDSEKTIKILKLTHCKVNFPPTHEFTSWSNLTSITLRRVLLDGDLNEIVNANCFLLEKLILIQCRGIEMLKILCSGHKWFKMLKVVSCFTIHEIIIDVPTLTTFHYRGYAHDVDISIDSASKLQDVVLYFISRRTLPSILDLDEMDLNHVETLTVSSYFIEALKQQPIIIPYVKEVQILMEKTSNCNLYDIANFLISCPLLERVFIDINGFFFNDGPYWMHHDAKRFLEFSGWFTHLKSVKVIGFKYSHLDILLARLFLEKSPQLRNMVLTTAKSRSEKVEMKDIEYPNHASVCDTEQYSPHALKVGDITPLIVLQYATPSNTLNTLYGRLSNSMFKIVSGSKALFNTNQSIHSN